MLKYAEVLYNLHLIVSTVCCDKRSNINKKARFRSQNYIGNIQYYKATMQAQDICLRMVILSSTKTYKINRFINLILLKNSITYLASAKNIYNINTK